MSPARSVVVLAPRYTSFDRFGGWSLEAPLTVQTQSGAPASLTNLEALFNSPLDHPSLSRGIGNANPLAGYCLESFLKRHGYAAHTVFDWEYDSALERALATDPLVVLFSTTFITDPRTLTACLDSLRRTIGDLPLVIGGPYVYKQAHAFARDAGESRRRSLAAHGVDTDEDLLFVEHPDQYISDAIYVAAEYGEQTALEVLALIERGGRRPADFTQIPNLVLMTTDRGWHATERRPETFDIDRDYVRWTEIDELPTSIPVRTSVGCPYRCRFCDFHRLHPHSTLRAVDSIVAELREATGLGRGFISFVDDNIFPTARRASELARGIIDAELDVIWGGFFRADQVDESNVQLIRESGCRFGFCGIESGDPDQLERMGREGDPQRAVAGFELCTAAGIDMLATFLVGFPGETRSTLDNTVELMNRLPVENPGSASFEIYPFYLSPSTAADAPAFRRRFGLRGRHRDWTHNTMTAAEAAHTWAPYMFRGVTKVPYNYKTTDVPSWWDVDQRREAFARRRELTLGFLDRVDDAEIQRLFAELYRWIVEPSKNAETPPWQNWLADRTRQPGAHRSE